MPATRARDGKVNLPGPSSGLAPLQRQQPHREIDPLFAGSVMNKLMAEIAAGAPRADVLLIADALSMERLKVAG
jgi:hypothetical protein